MARQFCWSCQCSIIILARRSSVHAGAANIRAQVPRDESQHKAGQTLSSEGQAAVCMEGQRAVRPGKGERKRDCFYDSP